MSADTPEVNGSVSTGCGLALAIGDNMNKNGGGANSDVNAHVPSALDGPNDETIWFEITENEECAKQAASELGWNDSSEMDVVAVIIRDDFREFYMPLNSDSSNYETLVESLEGTHLKQAAKWNEELDYTGDITEIDVGEDETEDSGEEVDWEELMGSEDDEEDTESDSIEDDIEQMFD